MATSRKKLSRAKAEAVTSAIDGLLRDTEHDDRMSPDLRRRLERTRGDVQALVNYLRKAERTTL